MSYRSESSATVTVDVLYRALKDSRADRKLLLVCLGIDMAKIKEFERVNQFIEDRVLVDALDYFLKNCEEGREWEKVVDALETNKDYRTAETIKQNYLTVAVPKQPDHYAVEVDSGDHDSGYCLFEPAQAVEEERQKRREHLEKMKDKTQRAYNTAEKKIVEYHDDIVSALETEEREVKKTLRIYTQNVEREYNELDRKIQDLIERTTTQQKNIKEAINRLRRGDSMAIATLREANQEMAKLEKIANSLDKGLEHYRRNTLQSFHGASTSKTVLQDLQSILIIDTYQCNSVEEEDYANVNDF